MGYTTWSYDEVMNIHHNNETKVSVTCLLVNATFKCPNFCHIVLFFQSPGTGWKAVKTVDGRTYFYHATSRQTTWTISDTWT